MGIGPELICNGVGNVGATLDHARWVGDGTVMGIVGAISGNWLHGFTT